MGGDFLELGEGLDFGDVCGWLVMGGEVRS